MLSKILHHISDLFSKPPKNRDIFFLMFWYYFCFNNNCSLVELFRFRISNQSKLQIILAGCNLDIPIWDFKLELYHMPNLIPSERIESCIYFIQGQKVMIDEDLASLYDVETRILNRAVSRNLDRFPQDFMFQLTPEEFRELKSKFATSKSWGGRRKAAYAFTEQGVAMLSSVLRSKKAVHVNIEIMRAFVRFRQIMSTHKDLVRKIHAMEKKYDTQIQSLFQAINQLMSPPGKSKKTIGFEMK